MKRLVAWVLTLVFSIVALAVPVFAHNKTEHDRIIESILFGEKNYKNTFVKGSEEYEALTALENAVAICLDQYNGSYVEKLKALNDQGIHGIPDSIKDIDFNGNEYHRKYTHKGWNYQYSDNKDKDKAHWDTRKTLLLQTVNDAFSFKLLAGKWLIFDFGYEDQCEAFAKFLYYLHVLGDYDCDDAKNKRYIIGCVMQMAREHASDDNPDIFWELESIFPILFESSTKAVAYKGLEQDMKLLAQQARKLGDLSNENFQQYHEIANELIEKLKSKVPGLLKEEPFFKGVFGN